MDSKTRAFVLDLLARCGGDVERCARFMRDSLRIGGVASNRAVIEAAIAQSAS